MKAELRKTFKPLHFISTYAHQADYNEMPAAWVKSLLDWPAHTFEMPTEMVLCPSDRDVSLLQGRVWYADEVLGREVEYNDAGDVISDSCRYIIEVVENCGDDGHIEFRCVGWALVTGTMLGEYMTAARECKRCYLFPAWDIYHDHQEVSETNERYK